MENQQKKIFANCSQTVRSHCEFRKVFADQFRIAKSNKPVHCSFAKISSHKTYAKFRIAKFTMSSQSQFRNAKTNFAMPNSNSQCENVAMPISQCQFQFRNANTLFICPNLCEISHCEIHNPLCEFRKPISHCKIHCLCEIHIRKPIFALPNSLPLRNSHLQALSSSVINATDFQTW